MSKSKTHKERVRLNKVQEELDRKHPEPMSLFHKREKTGEIPNQPLKKPEYSKGVVEKAAAAMADWENSDPFAYGRTALHVRQGYLDPREVVKEMGQRTIARRVAKVREVENAKVST